MSITMLPVHVGSSGAVLGLPTDQSADSIQKAGYAEAMRMFFIFIFCFEFVRDAQPVTSAKGGFAYQLQAERHRPALAEFRRSPKNLRVRKSFQRFHFYTDKFRPSRP